MNYRFLIARRYLISPHRVTLISIITSISIAGVSLGVAALIVVLSVMNGFFDLVRDLLVSFDPHVRIVSHESGGLAEPDTLMTLALSLPDVQNATPYVQGKALLAYDGTTDVNKVVIVRGVDPQSLGGVSQVTERVTMGDFDLERRENRPGVVIGANLAARLGLFPVSEVRGASDVALLSAAGLERLVMRGLGVPQVTTFEVRGLYELEAVYDQSHVFIALDEAQRLFRLQDRVSGIELRLNDLDHAGRVKTELQRLLPAGQFEVLTWYDLQKSLYDVMRLEKWGASLILTLIIIVAAFNIVGALTMIVIEKRRDLAVLQAMGVSRRNIRRIFLLEGALIGGVGSGIGLVLGLVLVWLQQRFQLVPLASAESFIIDAYPVAVEPLDMAVIVTVALGLCILASIYPSVRAAAVAPAVAMRNA